MSIKSDLKKIFPPLHPEGKKFIAIALIITVILELISLNLLFLGLGLTAFCYFFFRDPKRYTPQGENFIISPADGTILEIDDDVCLPKELGESEAIYHKIGIFMSVLNVHVNRVPISGKIEKIAYTSGKFFNASLDKASEHNERNAILMKTDNGYPVVFVQIAGLIARRIVCNVKEGDILKSGERFGIIRFGSRVNVYVPMTTKLNVDIGQTVIGGETILAKREINEQIKPL